MDERGFREFLSQRNYSSSQIDQAVAAVGAFESWLAARQARFASATIADLREYLADLVRDGDSSRQRLLDLARYCYVSQRNDLYIYFTALFGGRPIFPSIAARLEELAGAQIKDSVFAGLDLPPLGAPPEQYVPLTAILMERLRASLPPDMVRQVLAYNHHGIPASSFDRHKHWFRELQSLDAFLKKVHDEAVADLEEHARSGEIWFEQAITPEVVEFVRANQEILSAIHDGDRLYITKIPYATPEFLQERDPRRKRHYACHCPLARESILMSDLEIPPDWCYCSGGFQKLMFDVVFAQDHDVELLESVLRGDMRCRFAIKISPQAG